MNTVKIGWAKREISSNKPISIPGQMYMRISEGVLDPLFATALCIDGGAGQDTVIFCTCDITTVYTELFLGALKKIQTERPDIPKNAVILGATHTHTSMEFRNTPPKSPDGIEIYPGEKCRAETVDKIFEAVCEAWDTRKEGGISYGYSYAVVGHSRRVVYSQDMNEAYFNPAAPHGNCVQYGRTTDPEFSHYEAGADHSVNLMFTYDAEKKLTGIVVNIPCPSQTSEIHTQLSADYWNEIREEVKRVYGPDVYVLPQCAAAGDLTPRPMHYIPAETRRFRLKYKKNTDPTMSYMDRSMSRRHDIAERVIFCIQEVYEWASEEILTQIPVRHSCEEIYLTRRFISEEDKAWCEANIEQMRQQVPDPSQSTPEEYRKALTRFERIKVRHEMVLRYYRMQKDLPKLPFIIHVAQIGEIGFSTCPFELFFDYMHRIQARSPFTQTFVVQLAGDDQAGYLPTARAVQNKSYSASLFDNLVADVGGQELVEYTLDTLKKLKEEC